MKKDKFIFKIIVLFLLFTSCGPSAEHLYTEADKKMNEGKYAEAGKIYSKLTKRDDKLQDAFYYRGYCYFQDSNYTMALAMFQRLLYLKGVKETENIVLEVNNELLMNEELKVHQVPLEEVYYQLGITYYFLDSLDQSKRLFKRAMNKNYEMGACYLFQGLIWIKKGSNDNACKYFQIARNSGSPDADSLIRLYCQKVNK